jgi:ferredoxin-type protein NapG
MCETIPCVKACPSAALDHNLVDVDKARMGLAVLVDHENCLNFLGLRCDVCYRACPRIDKAITLEPQHNLRTARHAMFLPTVHSEACTGCGKCEQSCVLDTAAIKVLPVALARGAPGAQYRLGWEEKKKAGKSLVEERNLVDLPDRLPEGVRLEGHFDPGGNAAMHTPPNSASGVDSLQSSLPHPGRNGAPAGMPNVVPGGGLADRRSDEAPR